MPRRKKSRTKSDSIRFRCTEDEKAMYDQLAAATDQDLSEWIRDTLNRRAAEMFNQLAEGNPPIYQPPDTDK